MGKRLGVGLGSAVVVALLVWFCVHGMQTKRHSSAYRAETRKEAMFDEGNTRFGPREPLAPDYTPEINAISGRSGTVAAAGSVHVTVAAPLSGSSGAIWVTIRPESLDTVFQQRIKKVGDRNIAVFEDVEIGAHEARAAGGDWKSFVVKRGETTFVDLEIHGQFAVKGRVCDESGLPVRGATVFLTSSDYEDARVPVATADGQGNFSFLLSDKPGSVGASASGHGSSSLLRLDSIALNGVTLVLPSDGGMLRGRVFSPDGDLELGAQVVVGWDAIFAGDRLRPTSMVRQSTQEDGSFSFEGLPVGHLLITARSKTSAPWSAALQLEDGVESEMVIVLGRGGTIHGRVTDAGGMPLRAYVRCETWYAGLAPITRTAADGGFSLQAVPAGEVRVQAECGQELYGEVQLDVGEGEVRSAVIVASNSGPVHGIVQNLKGLPLQDWVVSLSDRSGFQGNTRTGPDGGFRFESVPASRYILRVLRNPTGPIALECREVRPSLVAKKLVVSPEAAQGASLRGRLFLPDRAAPRNAKAELVRRVEAQSGVVTHVEVDEEGVFSAQGLVAGQYEIWIVGSGIPRQRVAEALLQGGESTEVTAAVEDGGVIRLTLRTPPSNVGRTVHVAWSERHGMDVLMSSTSMSVDVELLPGNYLLRWCWVDSPHFSEACSVLSTLGEIAEATVDLE